MGVFRIRLAELQPSQLFISLDKLSAVERALDAGEPVTPVPVKLLHRRMVLTDGHTRAAAVFRKGGEFIDACLEEEQLNWKAYSICVKWCREEGVHTVADLASRVVSRSEFKLLWLDRCAEMHEELKKGDSS